MAFKPVERIRLPQTMAERYDIEPSTEEADKFIAKPKRAARKPKVEVVEQEQKEIHPKARIQRIVRDQREALYWLSQETGPIGLDLETSGLSPWKDSIAVVALYGPETETAAILQVWGLLDEELKAWLQEGRLFVTQNGAGFDILFLATHGLDWKQAQWYDTYVGEQVVITTDRRGIKKDLQALVKRRLGVDITKYAGARHNWMVEELSETQVRYIAEDIAFLPALMEAQYARAAEVDAERGTHPIYNNGVVDALRFEMDLLPIVVEMQLNGLPVDVPAIYRYEAEQLAKASEAEEGLAAIFGSGINWGSHVQVKRAFAERFGAPLSATGIDDLMILRDLSEGSEICEAIDLLIHRKHGAKRASMYGTDRDGNHFVDKYVYLGRIHPRFVQAGTDTGRFASNNPNFQQMPPDARAFIGNEPGVEIVAPDYSQIEIRIAANEAEDYEMIQTFAHTDVHTMIAASVFGIPPEEVTKEQRKLSKAMSFTLLFGGGAARLSDYARQLGADLPLYHARPLVEAFFDRFQDLKRMRGRAYGIAASGAPFVLKLPTGLRRVLSPGIDLSATRILNNIVQGTAAAGMKYGMVEAHNRGLTRYLGATVHDELVAAVPTAEAEEYGKELADAMIAGMARVCENVPVAVEVKRGAVWS